MSTFASITVHEMLVRYAAAHPDHDFARVPIAAEDALSLALSRWQNAPEYGTHELRAECERYLAAVERANRFQVVLFEGEQCATR